MSKFDRMDFDMTKTDIHSVLKSIKKSSDILNEYKITTKKYEKMLLKNLPKLNMRQSAKLSYTGKYSIINVEIEPPINPDDDLVIATYIIAIKDNVDGYTLYSEGISILKQEINKLEMEEFDNE